MATRRKPPAPPEHVSRTVEQMTKGIARLERIITEIEAFDPSKLTKRWSSQQTALETAIEGALASVFGHGTVEYQRYSSAAILDRGGVMMSFMEGIGDDGHEARQYVAEGKEESIQMLRQAVRWLQDEIGDSPDTRPSDDIQRSNSKYSRKIFIVHGHDEGVRETVARFVERIGFEAIILREQANQGRTIIEKIEAHGDVGFAIVLLTPDDVGGKSSAELQPRARQNVLLELGYFLGRLGRDRVCALATTAAIEIPTDFAGVVWEPFDSNGGWKQALARELGAVDFEIDWNRVMR